jgi:hypothetical protein
LYPLKSVGFTLRETNLLGFNCGKRLWHSNLENKRNTGGRPKLTHFLSKEIKKYFDNKSTFAANRILKKENKNVMFRQFTLSDGYNKFDFKEKMSFSTFLKYTPKYIKQPTRLSDLCSLCHLYKVKLKAILY